MTSIKIVCLTVLMMLLIACDGWTSNESDDDCDGSATTTDRFLASSYDSCNVSDTDLTGTWMIVSDYSVISGGTLEAEKTQRMTMTVSEHNDGSLNAYVCNFDESKRDYTFAAGDNTLSIYDGVAGATIELSISSNTVMTGAHVSDGSVVVRSSSVSAIKIKSTTSSALASLDLDYELDGFSYSEVSLAVACFEEDEGETQSSNLPISFEGQSLLFYADVDNNGTTEELSFRVLVPEDSNDDSQISLNFIDSGSQIKGGGSTNTTVTYQENSRSRIDLSATLIDGNTASNTAEFDFSTSL